MSLDTYIFFLVVLCGVTTIWTFRKVTGSAKDIKEIEYLVFACIWGTVIVTTYGQIMKNNHYDELEKLLGNPFASGLIFATWGLIAGGVAGLIERKTGIVKYLIKITKRFFLL